MLEKQITECYNGLEILKDRKDYYNRGFLTGRKQALQAELAYLTDLYLALTNTPKKAAENPISPPDAEPGQ
jgi:hypothetical protein